MNNPRQTMESVAQLVEPRLVMPAVVGSSPTVLPNQRLGS